MPPKVGSPAFPAAVVRSWLSRYPVDLCKWRVPAVRRRIDAWIAAGAFDVVIADFLTAGVQIPAGRGVPVVLFEHNVEHLIWKRLAAVEPHWWRRALFEIEWRKLRRCEKTTCEEVDLTVAVSDEDCRRLAELAPSGSFASIPTGVDVDYFKPAGRAEVPGRLVFSGSMDWHPNEDAVIYFTETILPRIRAQVPHVSLTVVGRNPSARLREFADRTGIHVTGTVDDVRPYLDEAEMSVVPLRAGSGTRLKIFEALAMGHAVVSTTVGAEGLALTPGRDVVLADDPDEFAQAVVFLLNNPNDREAIGDAGRQLVETHYSWERVAADFERTCTAVLPTGDPNESERIRSGLRRMRYGIVPRA